MGNSKRWKMQQKPTPGTRKHCSSMLFNRRLDISEYQSWASISLCSIWSDRLKFVMVHCIKDTSYVWGKTNKTCKFWTFWNYLLVCCVVNWITDLKTVYGLRMQIDGSTTTGCEQGLYICQKNTKVLLHLPCVGVDPPNLALLRHISSSENLWEC